MQPIVRITLGFQGAYYAISGIWPLFSIDTFELVTGEKYDHWLVKTVGALALVIGAALLFGVRKNEPTAETLFLSLAAALAFLLVDITFVARGVIDRIYLADAVVQFFLLSLLLWGAYRNRAENAARD